MSTFRSRVLSTAIGFAAVLAFGATACGTAHAASATAPAAKMTKAAPATKAPDTLKFDKDEAVAKTKGAFKGPRNFSHDFAVPMKAGQTLDVLLTDKPGTTFAYIYRPGAPQIEGEGRKKWTIHPTVDGTYIVHVFLTQSAVDKGDSSTWDLIVTRK